MAEKTKRKEVLFMKPQTQILMIALAIVFAIGLALTVALISLAAMERRAEVPRESTAEPLFSAPPASLYVPSISDPEPTPTQAPTAPAESGVGLAFESIGNGDCRLIGIGTCRDAFVVIPERSPKGERVAEIAPRALMGCATVTAVQIPSTVRRIGELALANCPNLIYVSVSEGNPSYRDEEGVLYSADGKTLLLYPPMRAGSTLYIPFSVTEIADMAFYQCAYLSSIRYAGTPEDWECINVGSKNYSLIAAAKSFSAGAGK
ncbi:MAG: hypothetical protein E7620_06520 [Ruminococcaceae bacterium]|nr:hypothetical protein [Oscillospiraceae bacterium]